MSDELLNANVSVASIEEVANGDKIKIKDGNGHSYSFWKKKRDGHPTRAFQDFQGLRPSVGSTLRVSYTVEHGEYKGRPVEYRNVFVITPIEVKDEPETREIDDAEIITAPPQSKTVTTDDVWEAKDRLHAAQTACNLAASIFEGAGKDLRNAPSHDLMRGVMEFAFQWIMDRKEGSPLRGMTEPESEPVGPDFDYMPSDPGITPF